MSVKSQRQTVVIGAGLGGLAAALRLRVAGHCVTVLEQSEVPGGKCGFYERDGFRFDTGPSVLTLPSVLSDLFHACGKRMEDYCQLEIVEPGCRYFFSDGMRFDAPATLEGFHAAIAEHFPSESDNFKRYTNYTQKLWEISGPAFLYNPLALRTLLKVPWGRLFRGALALAPVTMHRANRYFFKDPRLIQLFDRYATYNGSDPYRTPATFNVISHVELAFGSWRCVGGMYGLVNALMQLCNDMQVDVRLRTGAERIAFGRGNRLHGVHLRNSGFIPADSVVVNADAVSALTGTLFSEHSKHPQWCKRFARTEASGSGFVVLAALNHDQAKIAAHNVFFSDDYPLEFREQFANPGRAISKPTIYLHRMHGTPERPAAPAGMDGWFLLLNAPSLDRFSDWEEQKNAIADSVLNTLQSHRINFSATDVLWRHIRTPEFFQRRLGAWHGSLYGPASNHPLAAFFRVKNVLQKGRIAFAGGSAHPGGGIPLVLLSGQHAANSIHLP
jgi:phytoene desaturase